VSLKPGFMRTIYTFLAFFALPFCTYAQQHVSYPYDAAGNRVSRTIVLQSRAARSEALQNDSSFVQEMLVDASLRIYPNPVQSILTISLTDGQSQTPTIYSLLDTKGAQLQRGRLQAGSTRIDMSRLSPGIYILNIRMNNRPTTWKIIKK